MDKIKKLELKLVETTENMKKEIFNHNEIEASKHYTLALEISKEYEHLHKYQGGEGV